MVRIMTDNAANLPKHLLEQYGIGELCLTYTIDGQPADINAEFDGRSFYEAMRHGAVVQTSMVTPDAAQREMEPHLKTAMMCCISASPAASAVPAGAWGWWPRNWPRSIRTGRSAC